LMGRLNAVASSDRSNRAVVAWTTADPFFAICYLLSAITA
jgi:hypothetical protein